jgi:hypothetical protein
MQVHSRDSRGVQSRAGTCGSGSGGGKGPSPGGTGCRRQRCGPRSTAVSSGSALLIPNTGLAPRFWEVFHGAASRVCGHRHCLAGAQVCSRGRGSGLDRRQSQGCRERRAGGAAPVESGEADAEVHCMGQPRALHRTCSREVCQLADAQRLLGPAGGGSSERVSHRWRGGAGGGEVGRVPSDAACPSVPPQLRNPPGLLPHGLDVGWICPDVHFVQRVALGRSAWLGGKLCRASQVLGMEVQPRKSQQEYCGPRVLVLAGPGLPRRSS